MVHIHREAGVFGKGWAWITMNNISPGFEQEIGKDDHISEYDGLMFVSGLWDCMRVTQKSTRHSLLFFCD